jgi:crossover junction endodeoxyribonuclease RuvC
MDAHLVTALRIIGLDLSLTGTGIAWNTDHHGRPTIGARTVHTGRRRGHDRLNEILVDVAAACRARPHLVVLEDLFVGHNDNTLELAGLHGIVRHWLWTRTIPYALMAPATLKVWATGSGATRGPNAVHKMAVREHVTADYGRLVHIDDHNQADAVALLAAGCHVYGHPLADVPAAQLRALKAVQWPTFDLLIPPSGVAAALGSPPPGGVTKLSGA